MFLLNLSERFNGTKAPGSARRFASTRHVGEWLSLVEHLVRDQGVGGSNPLSPTNSFQSLAIQLSIQGQPRCLASEGASFLGISRLGCTSSYKIDYSR